MPSKLSLSYYRTASLLLVNNRSLILKKSPRRKASKGERYKI